MSLIIFIASIYTYIVLRVIFKIDFEILFKIPLFWAIFFILFIYFIITLIFKWRYDHVHYRIDDNKDNNENK